MKIDNYLATAKDMRGICPQSPETAAKKINDITHRLFHLLKKEDNENRLVEAMLLAYQDAPKQRGWLFWGSVEIENYCRSILFRS